MGHRVAVLHNGHLQQVDTPRSLYDSPCNLFVAGFIGSPAMNLREARLTAEGAQLGGAPLALPQDLRARLSGASSLMVGIRPEAAAVAPAGAPGALRLTVTLVEELGADAYVYGQLEGDQPQQRPWVLRVEGRDVPRLGETLSFTVAQQAAHFFDAASGERLS